MISVRPGGVRAVVLATALALPVLVGGQPREPDISTTIDATTINVGDPVTVTVRVRHAPDATVEWPESLALGSFELLDQLEVDPIPGDAGEMTQTGVELTVMAFELGDLALPSFEVDVVSATGERITLTTESAAVAVVSVGRDDEGALRDIKAPLEIPFGILTLLPWLLGLLALAAAGYWAYRRYRQRERPAVTIPVEPPRPAHEVALESLAALEASGLLELGEIKTYHIRVSDIVRVYAEDRFGIDAMEMTTGEVLAGLREHGVGSAVVADFRQLLDRCDLVKFAKFRPVAATCHDLIPLSRHLVELTTPSEPAPAEPSEAHAA
ncbi:MAG: hypothetical protein P8J30_10295 [Ilumatobacter sp.]|nr:hypothetical protein [Ilumatobacter sp.]